MDPYDLTQVWGYPPPPESGYRGTSWDDQNGGSQGSGFYYQPPFQDEQAYQWGYQEASPCQEDFPQQPEEKSNLELSMEAFMGHLTPCSTPQPEAKSELELMVE
ncbi:unnamed protein product [Linum trigynum]|uniref:Uncharacterized protein n=1 Tax=Linum trigynum TaxID=586398 RepID=A0AAV2E943_9ROSI